MLSKHAKIHRINHLISELESLEAFYVKDPGYYFNHLHWTFHVCNIYSTIYKYNSIHHDIPEIELIKTNDCDKYWLADPDIFNSEWKHEYKDGEILSMLRTKIVALELLKQLIEDKASLN